ncbi:MAG: hypothetical protein ACYCZ2_14920 [Lutibacter sp.]
MEISNFWFYTIMIVVILHIVVGFAYLLYKLSPKKDKKDNKIDQNDSF